MVLSKSFTLEEFTKSHTADVNKIENYPDKDSLENLKQLCKYVLQPIRDTINIPIHITSGYRKPLLNDLVGGASSSQHIKGQASDIIAEKISAYSLYQLIKQMYRDRLLSFDQCIYEDNEKTQWVHISYNPVKKKNREEFMQKSPGTGQKYILDITK